jgi:5-formyltetrahydrofolate cyclo-ligase
LGFNGNEVRIDKKNLNMIEKILFHRNEVRFPRPAHGRIPNFRYCEVAAENVTGLECFKRARVVKINPSLAQEPIRYLTLAYNKVLLTPTPSLGKSISLLNTH